MQQPAFVKPFDLRTFAVMLNIGFDAKRAFLNHTGLGNYSRSVITSLAHYFPDNNYLLYTPKTGKENHVQLFSSFPHVHIITPALPLFRSAWRSRYIVSQLKKDKLDIYHGLSHEIPVGIKSTAIKTVVTIHDLIFFRYPHYYKKIDRKIYETKINYACRYADKIVATSEQTKRDIVSFLGIPENKIEVVYQSCSPVFSSEISQEEYHIVRKKYRLPSRYLLYVGTVESRKNLMVLARALSAIPQDTSLVVVGKHTVYAGEVKNFLENEHLTSRVKFLEHVPFADLPKIYKQAAMFLCPSEFEGFGIPILEALHSGIPVIAATGSCLEESGGPDSIYLPPHDPAAWADAINYLLDQPAKRAEMTIRGKAFASYFTEERQAAQLLALYQALVKQ